MFCNGVTRGIITLLHLFIGAGAGMCVVYTLVRWKSASNCLPPMVEISGGILKLTTQTPDICESAFVALVAIFFLNIVMCGFINCLWNQSCFIFLHLFMTLLMAVFLVFGASVFTVYKMLWCDHLTQYMATDHSCHRAAEWWDYEHYTHNMTSFYHRLDLQMIGVWSIVPGALVAVLFYAIALRLAGSVSSSATLTEQSTLVRPGPNNDGVLNCDETTPLLINSTNRGGVTGNQNEPSH